eukprot:4606987-Lingulodinium_polyedra.AAC.1
MCIRDREWSEQNTKSCRFQRGGPRSVRDVDVQLRREVLPGRLSRACRPRRPGPRRGSTAGAST